MSEIQRQRELAHLYDRREIPPPTVLQVIRAWWERLWAS